MLQNNIALKMAELYEKRNTKYTKHVVFPFPSVRTIPGKTYLGTVSWTSGNERWLNSHAVVNIGLGTQSRTEVGRDYIVAKYKLPLRARGSQAEMIKLYRKLPTYANPGEYDDMVYVDIKSAFWSIIRAVGWNVDYNPGLWVGKKSENADFPLADDKVARSSLVTLGILTDVTCHQNGSFFTERLGGIYTNYGLWALVTDVLQGVASDMLQLNPVYVNTDGYIIKRKYTDIALEIISQWGLSASVKNEGETTVKGVGVYRIGSKETKNFYRPINSYHTGINAFDTSWLRHRMLKFSRATRLNI
jgi:hypothetical protein